MMRKAMTLALAAVMVTSFGTFAGAESLLNASSLEGRAVDAAGRGVGSQRVELVRGTLVMSVTTTNGSGDWVFTDVAPGDYVVRMNIGGKIAGVRVSVATGHSVAGTLIVVPTAGVSAQIGAVAAGLLSNLASVLPTIAAATVSAGTAVGIETEAASLSPEIVQQIVNALPTTARLAFAEQVVAALNANPGAAADPAVQALKSALEAVVESGGNAPINLS
jgi:hypothetical protein